MIDLLLHFGVERCYLCGSRDVSDGRTDTGDYSCGDCPASYDFVGSNGDIILYGTDHFVTVSDRFPWIAVACYISHLREEEGVTFE